MNPAELYPEESFHSIPGDLQLTLDEPGNMLPRECAAVAIRAEVWESRAGWLALGNGGLGLTIIALVVLYMWRART